MSTGAAPDPDGSAKSRIRRTALELYAVKGRSTSLREVARAAGVAPGLVAHHFGGKEGLRAAVEDHAIERFQDALDAVPLTGTPAAVGRRRDTAVVELLRGDPALWAYVRRVVVAPDPGDESFLRRVVTLAVEQSAAMQAVGVAPAEVETGRVAVSALVRQLGRLLLEPALGQMWTYAVESGEASGPAPTVRVGLSE